MINFFIELAEIVQESLKEDKLNEEGRKQRTFEELYKLQGLTAVPSRVWLRRYKGKLNPMCFAKFGLSSKPATKYEEEPESLIRIFPDGEMKIKFRRQVGAEVDRQGSIYEELMSIELENEAQKKNGGRRKAKVVFF